MPPDSVAPLHAVDGRVQVPQHLALSRTNGAVHAAQCAAHNQHHHDCSTHRGHALQVTRGCSAQGKARRGGLSPKLPTLVDVCRCRQDHMHMGYFRASTSRVPPLSSNSLGQLENNLSTPSRGPAPWISAGPQQGRLRAHHTGSFQNSTPEMVMPHGRLMIPRFLGMLVGW